MLMHNTIKVKVYFINYYFYQKLKKHLEAYYRFVKWTKKITVLSNQFKSRVTIESTFRIARKHETGLKPLTV
jgi:hypothetical protein